MTKHREGFRPLAYVCMAAALLAVMLLCVCAGSVAIPVRDTCTVLRCVLTGQAVPEGVHGNILLFVRIPRVLAVALTGASLSLCGCAMQGLLRNPLADGSTLGVSSGASLGAALAIAFGVAVPGMGDMGVTGIAILFAFGSLLLILGLAWRLDGTLSTNTIILVGIVFSMFASALINVVIAFAGEKVKNITFWTMGSLAGADMGDVGLLAAALAVCAFVLLRRGRELNAFSLGEDTARSVGVHVRRVKLEVLIGVSALIGVCVSVGGTIGFVGLVTPQMTRLIVGPNHRRLLPASVFTGAVFLMLADLCARTLLNPRELPVGVVTSLIGAIAFVGIFAGRRRG